jgi:hypothetical protein
VKEKSVITYIYKKKAESRREEKEGGKKFYLTR